MKRNEMIEFDKIIERWAEIAVTEHARSRIRETDCILEEGKLRKSLKDTTDSKIFMETCGTPPLASMDEVREILQKAERDECLTPYQLERVERGLVAVQRLKGYLSGGKRYGNSLAYYEENLDDMGQLRNEISRQIRGGVVDDYASKELQQLRSEIARLEEKMRQKAQQAVRANKQYVADTYSTMRNGRVCISVKREYKHKVAGNIIDQSSTGNTVFIEPAGTAKIAEEIAALQIAEENEVYRILYTLTAMVLDGAAVMEGNIKLIEKLDYIFSKGKLSMTLDGIEPRIIPDRQIRLRDARHPLMNRETTVPLQFEIGGKVRGIVITGPNTGGKTVSIKTVALNCMMAQCGLHVTCSEADICMNSLILCDIGDGQNLTENLSTFSSHIRNVLEIIETVDRDSLVVMDELGSGTDPTEGMGIAIAIIEELQKSGCLFLLTTHYPQVKEYAQKAEGIVNARMEFDRETLQPTYHMVTGEAGESCAIYIAQKLGMPERMLRTAVTASYGQEAADAWSFAQKESEPSPKAGSRLHNKKKAAASLHDKFHIGDSVMIYPDKKLGIVCEPVNEKGVLRVQLPGKKIWINHKRVNLEVAASELYPEDYDFSILFETVSQRKMRHDMERKYVEGSIIYEEE